VPLCAVQIMRGGCNVDKRPGELNGQLRSIFAPQPPIIWSICTAKIRKNPKNPCPRTKFWKKSGLRQSGQPKISYRLMPSATVDQRNGGCNWLAKIWSSSFCQLIGFGWLIGRWCQWLLL
jgi:hypothetical protein